MSCPDCFKGAVHDHAEPKGTIETVYGRKTYIAGEPGTTTSKSAILYLPDAFSLKLVNNKLLADRYAAGTGCRVLIPDAVLHGGIDPSALPKMEVLMDPLESWSISAILSKVWAFVSVLPSVVPFMIWGHPRNVYPDLLRYAREMRKDLPPGGKLGIAGFCWGGYGSTTLCTETAVEGGTERLIDAQFNGHPSFLKAPDMVVDAIAKYKVPYSSAVAAADVMFNEKVALETEAAVRAKVGPPEENDYEFRIYKGCKHGFCVRATPDTANMDGYHAAAKQAVDWFNKYLN